MRTTPKALVAAAALLGSQASVRQITWQDVAPVRARLEARGVTAGGFPAYVTRIRDANAGRVREGDLDHLVFYMLQSARVTRLPRIEPALSAKAFVDGLDERERAMFVRDGHADVARVPEAVRARATALLRELDSDSRDPRVSYFRDLVSAVFPTRGERHSGILHEYLRAMRFVYEKEFVAQRAPGAAEAVADLYRTRGLSTDTAVEAGYLVYQGLGVVKALRDDRPIRRVLIVGPGLDLAPRTAFSDERPPESYQPWAVLDALLALGVADVKDLEIVAADINPRVVRHLARARVAPPVLSIASEIGDSPTVTLTNEFRRYIAEVGRALEAPQARVPGLVTHGRRTVEVSAAAARAVTARPLDIVTERLAGAPFDLAIATNILPYFDDGEVILAMSNLAAMIAPGGFLVHNEGRQLVADAGADLGLPLNQARAATIATVRGGPPLFDRVFVHERKPLY